MAEAGQPEAPHAAVESFVERMRSLTDADRRVVAELRGSLDEVFREKAVRAGVEAIAPHAELYVRARARVAAAHLPTTLEEREPNAEWAGISRLVQLAIDEALVGMVGSRTLHPNHLRELFAPWPPELARP